MGKQIFFNGGFHEETDKLLSIQDRGLCFADGLFEVIRCIGGRFLLFSNHIERMKESAKFLRMDFPSSASAEELLSVCKDLSKSC